MNHTLVDLIACVMAAVLLLGGISAMPVADRMAEMVPAGPRDSAGKLQAALRVDAESRPSAEQAQAERSDQLILSFAGDCTLGSEDYLRHTAASFISTIKEKGFDWPFSGVMEIFLSDDLTLVNLESTFTEYAKAADKSFTFRAPPAYAEILAQGGVEAVNLANNHTMDYGWRGFEDTMAALDAWGVAYCGHNRPGVAEAKGLNIALLGFTYPLMKSELEKLYKDIEAYRQREDIALIVVSFHWGREMTYSPKEEQIRAARGAIDHGADVVVGTHPHVLQPIEMYEGKPIFYSLGNFSFGGNTSPRDFDTAIMRVTYDVTPEGPKLARLEAIPCSISEKPLGTYQDFRPVAVHGNDAERVLGKLGNGAEGFPDGFFQTGLWDLRMGE